MAAARSVSPAPMRPSSPINVRPASPADFRSVSPAPSPRAASPVPGANQLDLSALMPSSQSWANQQFAASANPFNSNIPAAMPTQPAAQRSTSPIPTYQFPGSVQNSAYPASAAGSVQNSMFPGSVQNSAYPASVQNSTYNAYNSVPTYGSGTPFLASPGQTPAIQTREQQQLRQQQMMQQTTTGKLPPAFTNNRGQKITMDGVQLMPPGYNISHWGGGARSHFGADTTKYNVSSSVPRRAYDHSTSGIGSWPSSSSPGQQAMYDYLRYQTNNVSQWQAAGIMGSIM